MNEVIRTILDRRSIRRYLNKPVEPEKIDLIVKCGQYAPSAKNGQSWHFTIVTNRTLLSKISVADKPECANLSNVQINKMCQDPDFDSFRGAPMAIIVSGENEAKFAAADCANATQNMALATHALGLGGCYIASFLKAFDTSAKDELLQELKIPNNYSPLYALAIGYKKGEPRKPYPRRDNTITYVK